MFEVYWVMCAVLGLVIFLFTIIAAITHVDCKDQRSADQLKAILLLWPTILLWPIVAVAIPFALVYTLVVGIHSAFKEF